jgi:hypothetical protein
MSAMTLSSVGTSRARCCPKAANLAVLVHGDGGPEDIAEVLERLDDTQKNALIVVLAGMVDPEQPVGKGLSWTDCHEERGVADAGVAGAEAAARARWWRR